MTRRRKKRRVHEGVSGLSQLGMSTLPGSSATWVAGYSKDWLPGRVAPTPAAADSSKKVITQPQDVTVLALPGTGRSCPERQTPPPPPQHP